MSIHIFPSKEESGHKLYQLKETTLVKFFFPVVLIIKGCNEILIYSITEDLYYYVKLSSPLLFESRTVTSYYSPEIKGFLDLGDYLAFFSFSFTVGANPYFSSTFYTRYLKKSDFPDQELLTGFEQMSTKFISKDEDALTLQFSKSLLSVGTNTVGLVQITESEYSLGEVIQISADSFFVWKKGSKALIFKMQPINFADS